VYFVFRGLRRERWLLVLLRITCRVFCVQRFEERAKPLNTKIHDLWSSTKLTITSLSSNLWTQKYTCDPKQNIHVLLELMTTEKHIETISLCCQHQIKKGPGWLNELGSWIIYQIIQAYHFSNISAISWRPVLVLEEARVPGENHRPWASNW
jgi:hypothetical protein